jgi:DNA-binding LytR/AlgR family response regulator
MSDCLKILIVEDEFITADTLRDYLNELGHEVVAIVKNALDAIDILDEKKTDFAIIDINIQGKKNGIWVAKKIQEYYGLPFLFLTANSDKATVKEAVETKPFGFLVKPFQKHDIYTAIELAMTNFNASQIHINKEVAPNTESEQVKVVYFKVQNSYEKIDIDDIMYIKSDLKHIDVFTKKRKFTLRMSLVEFTDPLAKNVFIRVHRSYVVNKNYIDRFDGSSIEIKDSIIPLGGAYKDSFKQVFKLY